MNLFDDSFSLWRWQGDDLLQLQNVGSKVKLNQLKKEITQEKKF